MHFIFQFWQGLVLTALVSLLGGLLMNPVKKISKAYAELMEVAKSTHSELTLQRNNCLMTLQNQGDSQITLLTKAVETLEAIHLDQARLLGKLDK